MNKKLTIAGAGIIAAAALFFFARNTQQPPVQQTQGMIRHAGPAVKTLCVKAIQNLSQQPVDMTGVDDELVAQLRKTGFEANKAGEGACEATVVSEIVEVSGRGRRSAQIDYRLLLTGEEMPRLAASAKGKTPEAPAAKAAVMGFVEASKKAQDVASREAVIAAFEQQAQQIQIAIKNGLPEKFQSR